jgi:hypothetical protein
VNANKAREVALAEAEKNMKLEARDIEASRERGINIDEEHPFADEYAKILKDIERGPAVVDKIIPIDATSGMVAKDGEEVMFAMPFLFCATSKPLEVWLGLLLETIQVTHFIYIYIIHL